MTLGVSPLEKSVKKFFPVWDALIGFVPAALALSAGALVFAPGTLIGRVGLLDFAVAHRSLLGAITLTSSAILVGLLIPLGFRGVKRALWSRKARRRLRALTRSERNLLNQYLTRKTAILVLDGGSGATSSLLAAGIIRRMIEPRDPALGSGFAIAPWAFAYLRENRHLLENAEVSNAGIRVNAEVRRMPGREQIADQLSRPSES
jgi:hypothetical protein